ncbi:hypothetical protein KBY96_13550 [Cyanobium sp. ATX 6A2]|uniref:hypothetical protein n=1 Tax=Cyanobium sp. ATX 6A2 TaxID=2823700 RepID=UPI0020CECB11|nr:hypothetical protein [Cyanobium sp. ATX 6A2]MCP9888950.1 hypothetical protein [Cyanobium sp. ATX 6A2]
MSRAVRGRHAAAGLALTALALAVLVLPSAAQAVVIEYFFNNARFTDNFQSRKDWTGFINGTFNFDGTTVTQPNISISIFNETNQLVASNTSFTEINFSTFTFNNTTYQTLNFFVPTGQVARFSVERSPDGSSVRLLGAGNLNTGSNTVFGYCLQPSGSFCQPPGQLVGADSFGSGASIVPVPGPLSLLGLLPMGALASARRRLRRRYRNETAKASSALS